MTTSGLGKNRNWKLLWLGQAISVVGTYVFDITIVLWITTRLAKGQPWAPAAVGGVLIAAAVPTMLLGPVSGVFVDRWDHRKTMMISDACRAVLILALLPLAWPSVANPLAPWLRVALIYLVVVGINCFAQFFNPARFAILGAVVDKADIATASGRQMATGSLAAIIGPPLAAPVLFVFGVQWALVINAVSFAVSYATIRAMRIPRAASSPSASATLSPKPTSESSPDPAAQFPPDPAAQPSLQLPPDPATQFTPEPVGQPSPQAVGQPPPPPPSQPPPQPERLPFRDDFKAGLQFFATSRVLVALTIGVVIATLGAGALNALNVFFVTHNLHTAAKWYGTLQGAEGVGGVLGALATGWIVGRLGSSRAVWVGIIVSGVLVIGYARSSALVVAIVFMALTGLAVTIVNTALTPLLLSVTPQEMIGRVTAVINPIQYAASILSMAVAGFLASSVMRNFHVVIAGVTFGTYDTIFTFVGLLFVAGGACLIRPLREPRQGTDRPAETGQLTSAS
jgi:MFS family permease